MRTLFVGLLLSLAVCSSGYSCTIDTYDSAPVPSTCSFTQGGYFYCNLSVFGTLATDQIYNVTVRYPGQFSAAVAGWDENSRTDHFIGVFFTTYPGTGTQLRVMICR